MLNITAVIVTNNRLALLQEALAAVKGQSYASKSIVVVNNASTDGTREWLDEQSGIITIHQDNLGGSGGFYTGIKKALEINSDWVWVMDDDTICHPDTLEKLVSKLSSVNEPVGFVGSKCIWTDGTPHLMNLPAIKPTFNSKIPFNKFDDRGLLLIETCSFVSLLINCNTVKRIGLPYRDFFIWGDDQEYSRRVTQTGDLGLYCNDSIVLHKTPINYFPDFYRDKPANLWKHKYGFRNEFFMIKKTKGMVYFMVWLPAKVLYTSLKLIKIRKNDRFKFIRTLTGSAWDSIFFNPKIDNI